MNFLDNSKNEEAIEEFEKLKIERIFEQELFSDSESTIRGLLKLGMDVFVSSSTFQPTIEEYFRRKGILDLFKEIIGYRPGFEKGADHFNHINSTHQVQFNDMVFVGDSLKDHERSQGFCKFIGVKGEATPQIGAVMADQAREFAHAFGNGYERTGSILGFGSYGIFDLEKINDIISNSPAYDKVISFNTTSAGRNSIQGFNLF